MEVIRGVGSIARQPGAPRQARGSGGFRVEQARTPASAPASGVEAVGLSGMLALQEAPERDLADRAARRRGKELLEALAALQRGMLGMGGTGDPGRLADLAEDVPVADDPGLRAAVAEIVLRARIEAARISMGSEADSQESIESS